jgi:hypothetical protein
VLSNEKGFRPWPSIVMPEYKPGCDIPSVGNFADKKYVFNEVGHMDLLRTIVHRFGQATANILKSFL